MQIMVIRLKDGCMFVGRAFDALGHPEHDKKYGHVILPPYESETLGAAALGGKLNEDQAALLYNLALPLYPEKSEGDTTAGEEWKKE